MYLWKKINFQYECVIKFQWHVQMRGSIGYFMRWSFWVPQPCFDPTCNVGRVFVLKIFKFAIFFCLHFHFNFSCSMDLECIMMYLYTSCVNKELQQQCLIDDEVAYQSSFNKILHLPFNIPNVIFVTIQVLGYMKTIWNSNGPFFKIIQSFHLWMGNKTKGALGKQHHLSICKAKMLHSLSFYQF